MIKLEHTEVFGWEAAIRGMRSPMNSWDKSDSSFCSSITNCPKHTEVCACGNYCVGENDLKLMKSLSKAGSDHGKFLRMINVTVDITAPLYWWKEFDTYKVGTVANSCSTMHKIHAKEFTLDDFSHEHLIDENDETLTWGETIPLVTLDIIIHALNRYRNKYLETKTKPMKDEAKRAPLMKKYWWQMIQLLPTSYNQKRTVQLNYQVLKSMYYARKNHKLDEWREFCKWAETLPYFKEICVELD